MLRSFKRNRKSRSSSRFTASTKKTSSFGSKLIYFGLGVATIYGGLVIGNFDTRGWIDPAPFETNRLTMPDGTNIFYKWHDQLSSDPKGIVWIFNGYGYNTNTYKDFAASLNKHGYIVLTYDHRGFGKSEGIRRRVDSYDEYLNDASYVYKFIKDTYPDLPLFTLGFSFGATTAMAYGLKNVDHDIDGFILAGVTSHIDAAVPGSLFRRIIDGLNNVHPDFPLQPMYESNLCKDDIFLDNFINDPWNEFSHAKAGYTSNVLKGIDNIVEDIRKWDKPILLQHGADDNFCDPEQSQYVYDRISSTDKTIEIFENHGHEFYNTSDSLPVMKVVEWLDHRVL
eukprot:TRINITY_DN7524_c0_g1_i1.p1 TRINITY_DN7524_c0_g1~~TRINITY_DN7524_c0_g1_i1.p1  ORF type:complete len:339 (-),score=70.63 TRINITY_DN7524_c0_g1_i1:75-1091(-)